MANFFVYTLTVPSFRETLRSRFQTAAGKVGQLRTPPGEGIRHFGGVTARVGNLPNIVWQQLENSDQSEPGRPG